MELRHLRYFVAVVEEQSYTKAAERLFISQPPLSRQIQNLESTLGVQLIERGSRPVKTTEVGQFLYLHAKKLLAHAEEIKTMTQRVGSAEKTLTIGFVGSLLYGLLPKIIYLFRQQQPQLKIDLKEMNTKLQIAALKEGKIDMGFGRLRISDPAIHRILLRDEPLMVAVHSQHHLANTKNGLYLSSLIDENIFIFPNYSKPNFSTQVRSIFYEHGLDPSNLREIREVQLALGLVAASEGICIIPQSAKSIQIPNLKFIPILDNAAVSPIFLATRNMDENSNIRSLLECTYQVYDEESITYNRKFI
ncbi:MAG TPA: LysR family transcriptional regulator [Thiopseudomonas sp.]|nr:LysR family transcriptional regulator [Thiopseudomonas sp.]